MRYHSKDGWLVSGFYAEDVKPPKKANELAIEVWCGDEGVRDLEVSVLKERDDIGTVTSQKVGPSAW